MSIDGFAILALCNTPQISCTILRLHLRKCGRHGLKLIFTNWNRKRWPEPCQLNVMPTLLITINSVLYNSFHSNLRVQWINWAKWMDMYFWWCKSCTEGQSTSTRCIHHWNVSTQNKTSFPMYGCSWDFSTNLCRKGLLSSIGCLMMGHCKSTNWLHKDRSEVYAERSMNCPHENHENNILGIATFMQKLTTSTDGPVKCTATMQGWKFKKSTLLEKNHRKKRVESYSTSVAESSNGSRVHFQSFFIMIFLWQGSLFKFSSILCFCTFCRSSLLGDKFYRKF